MNMLGRILGGLGLVALSAVYSAACVAPGPVDSEPEDIGPDSSEDVSPEEDVAEASSEVGSCHAVTTCPDPKSCGSWSSYYTCGEVCLAAISCNGCPHPPDPEDPCEPNPQKGLRPVYEKFRSCILQNGSSCTEYSSYNGGIISCGCTP